MSILDPTVLLFQLDWSAALALFWYLVILDFPRYTLSFFATLASETVRRPRAPLLAFRPSTTVIVAGHNERACLRRCVRSLREQAYPRLEIIVVDDGSTDGMADEMRTLREEGMIDLALRGRTRSGKSSACNLGLSHARGDVVVVIDADSTFDRDAVARVVAPLADEEVGAVAGNIGVRNAGRGLLCALQGIEYLIAISLGKRVLDTLGIVTCASGAFSAFRRDALQRLGGFDVGPGEDLDMTLRLRQAGWRVRFADDAWCLTDVPESFRRYVRQRLRWERDSLRLRMRRHRNTLDPRPLGFVPMEVLQQLEFVVVNLVVTIVFPFYIVYLFYTYGIAALTVLSLVAFSYVVLDVIAVMCALFVADRPALRPSIGAVLVYGIFNGFIVRSIRLVAYIQEWVFERSRQDDYVPIKVRQEVPLP
jgi:cellulose synthase/poly-beta-1,6-N-acetylglucosamine synthase-like glycosyltransferase